MGIWWGTPAELEVDLKGLKCRAVGIMSCINVACAGVTIIPEDDETG